MPKTTSGEGLCGCGRPLPHKGRCAARRENNEAATITTKRKSAPAKTLHPNGSGIHVSLTEAGLNNAIAALLPSLTIAKRTEILEEMLNAKIA